MRRFSKTQHIQIAGRQLRINNNIYQGCFCEILEDLFHQMSAMLSHHSKLLFLRFDLHCEKFTQDNKIMSDWMRLFKRKLKRFYGFSRIGYLWVRERQKAEHQHYHVVLILDGNKVQHPSNIFDIAKQVSDQHTVPAPYVPKNSYYKISRGDSESFDTAYYRGSYLAKSRSKRKDLARSFGSSNIRPRNED